MSPLALLLGAALAQTPVVVEDLTPVVPVGEAAPEAAPTLRVTAGLVLRVVDREAAIQATVAAAQFGGWFSSLTPDAVTVRIPTGQVDPFLAGAASLGRVEGRSYDRADLGGQIVDLESRLAARRDVLARYMAVLADASPKAVVQVEREITRVVSEIEGIEGQLKVLRDRAAFAEVTLSFRYRDRRAPRRDGSSSFAWLNSMNVADLLDAVESGTRGSRSRALAAAPAGFAPYKKAGRFQALSPDGVAYRVRSARNKPAAALPFWKEALRSRMAEAGYHIVAEADVQSADGAKGSLLELGAANGQQDQAYLVAIFVDGRHLVIVEATGEAERFAKRRDAVLAAVSAIQL